MDIISILLKIVRNPEILDNYKELKKYFKDDNVINALEYLIQNVNSNNIAKDKHRENY